MASRANYWWLLVVFVAIYEGTQDLTRLLTRGQNCCVLVELEELTNSAKNQSSNDASWHSTHFAEERLLCLLDDSNKYSKENTIAAVSRQNMFAETAVWSQ